MIYITGDIHAAPSYRFSEESFPEQKEMSKDDFGIICGDFGLVWDKVPQSREKNLLKWLNNKPFTTLFVDGNHENFDRLESYPEEEWHGGKVHRISDSVFHLMRGEMFDVGGVNIFAFGGARSHDIRGLATKEELEKDYSAGILRKSDPNYIQKKRMLHRATNIYPYREEGKSWWKQEMPSEAEMAHGEETLQKHGMQADFVVTHDGPASSVTLLAHGEYSIDPVNQYLEKIRQEMSYKKWFFGHYHLNKAINNKEIVLFEQLIRIH